MNINDIKNLVDDDLNAVNDLIMAKLHSDVALINQLGFYIINNGGKRVRPMLVLLTAKALDYQGSDHHTLAATIEFIHTATLLHDDVVDESELRRGQQTANDLFGNAASVLTGDYLYSRAFQMMVDVNEMQVMSILSNATNVIAEGEVMQLMNCNNPDISVHNYYRVIYCKTAKLFEAAAQLGAVIAKTPTIETNLIAYGKHLGNAFQLVDDALDYDADTDVLGKNLGDDLAEGKPTLPLIHALQNAGQNDQAVIRDAIKNSDKSQFEQILSILKANDSINFTLNAAKNEVDQALSALQALPKTPYRDALAALAEFTIQRNN